MYLYRLCLLWSVSYRASNPNLHDSIWLVWNIEKHRNTHQAPYRLLQMLLYCQMEKTLETKVPFYRVEGTRLCL